MSTDEGGSGAEHRRRAVFNIDLDLIVTDWFFDELFGLDAEDIVGRVYWERMSSDAGRMTRLRTLRETGRFEGIVVVADQNNEHVAVHAISTPLQRNGSRVGWRVDLREVFGP
jgi:PAS domain-containing protein